MPVHSDAMNNLPEMLYRGDSASGGHRKLKDTWDREYLLTDLTGGGEGRKFFKAPLLTSVSNHVEIRPEDTSFLSFSTNYNRAKHFATHGFPKQYELTAENSREWDRIVYWCRTSVFQDVKEREPGLYTATFPWRVKKPAGLDPTPDELARQFVDEHQAGKSVRVLLVDCVQYFEHKKDAGEKGVYTALTYSENDQEWLLLPVDPFIGNREEHTGEFTGKIHNGFIDGWEKLRFVGSITEKNEGWI